MPENNRSWLERVKDSREFTHELRHVTDTTSDRDFAGRVAGVLTLTAMYAKMEAGFVTEIEGPDGSGFEQGLTLEQHVRKVIPAVKLMKPHEIDWLREDTHDHDNLPWLEVLQVAKRKFPFNKEIEYGEFIVRKSLLERQEAVA